MSKPVSSSLRTSSIILHIGAKKTGKTQGTLNMCRDMFIKQHKPVLLLDIGRQPEYETFIPIELEDVGQFNRLATRHKVPFFRCRVEDLEQTIRFFDLVNKNVRNSFVVFEDSTSYMRGNLPSKMQNLIFNSRNVNNDYLFNLHSLREPAPVLLAHSEMLVLRKTADGKLPTKVPVPEKIAAAMQAIKQENERLYPRADQPKLAYRLIDLTTAD
jgi:hypothetical protein